MKKLLILGGSRFILPVIESAKKLGIYTITCDYLPDNYAHAFSDEYRNVSIIDKEAVLACARELGIDGIVSFACDPGVVTAAYVAEQMGLPNVGPYKSVCILQNKGLFRKFLAENGFNTPVARHYTEISEALKNTELFHWPVIVKPTDSAGSKGVTRVDTPETLEESIKYALSFSHNSEFIIEEFIEQKGCASSSECFSVEGVLRFVSFDAQRFDRTAENPYAPSAHSWPSTFSAEQEAELTSELQRLLKLLDMQTSLYNVESRISKDGKAYIMECSPRGGGNRLAEMLRYATGVDLIENTVRAAVGIPVKDVAQRPYLGFWAEIVLHSTVSGIFDSLWVSDEIATNVVERDVWIKEGNNIGGFSGANEAIGTLVLRFDTQERLEEVLAEQKKFVEVRVK